MKRIDLC